MRRPSHQKDINKIDARIFSIFQQTQIKFDLIHYLVVRINKCRATKKNICLKIDEKMIANLCVYSSQTKIVPLVSE
jgi:hypothetical protein